MRPVWARNLDRKELPMEKRNPALRLVAASAVAAGLMAGSYGIATAASGSESTDASGTASSSGSAVTQTAASGGAPTGQGAWGGQRPDETVLTGDTAAKVKAAAVAKVGSGATVVRVETDADGHAAYEAHMVKADGTPVTVYVDKTFAVVSVESR
jgi:uncharacterized membrane protein YkoI